MAEHIRIILRKIISVISCLTHFVFYQLWTSARKQNSLVFDGDHDQSHWGWSWLERWMAARPWETAYLDECEEKPTDEGLKKDGHLKAEEELEKKHSPLKNSTSELLQENSQQQNLPELPPSSSAEIAVDSQQGETLTSCELSTKHQTLTSSISSRLMKPTKSSSSRSTSNPNASAALEAHSETMAKGLQDGSTSYVKHDHFRREALPVEAMPKNKGVFKRHSFSGPLKGMQENPTTNSPSLAIWL